MLSSKKTEYYYMWGIKIPVFIIPFLPLYISPSMVFPYVTGKNFAFRVLVELAAVFWIGLITENKKYRSNNSAIVLSILTFTFIAGLADILGVNPYDSFWSNYERMEGYITILHLALYFLIIRSILQTRKEWLLFFNSILAGSFFVCLYSLAAPTATGGSRIWMEYGKRVYGTVGNPPFLAAYLLLTIFVGLIVFLNTQKKYLKVFYIFLILLNAVVIYLTATRGVILSGVVGLIIMSMFYISTRVKTSKWKPIKTAAIMAIIICFIIVAVTMIISDKNYIIEQDITLSRFASMFSDDSVNARLNSWKMAWNGIKERPVLGWGQENFIGIYTVNPIPLKGEQIWTDRAHNIIIEWLINAGILGLLSYMAILGSALYLIRQGYRRKLFSKKESFTITTALFVYFIQNLFTFDTINTYFIFFALMAYIDVIGTTKDKSGSGSEVVVATRIKIKSLSLMLLALIVFSVISYYATYKPMEESRRSLQISRSILDYKSFSTLLSDFKNALAFHTFGDSDVRERMEFLSKRYILFYERFSEEGALKFLEATVIELEKEILKNYYNLEYLTRVIELYNKIAFYEPAFVSKAESLIRGCMSINPRYEWLNYALADIYKLKKEYTKMFEIGENMAALDPNNDQKQLKLALVAISLKKEHIVMLAIEKIRKIREAMYPNIALGKNPVFATNELYFIAEAYLEVKDFQKALDYLRQVVDMNPDIAKYHYDLAYAYLNLGDKTNAIKEAKMAAELSPSLYGEITKKIIASLNK
jgi:oligosaccharide repeat unit polymerase